MQITYTSVALLSLLVAVSALVQESFSFQSNWEYVLYTPNALRHGLEGPAVSPTGKVTVGSVMGEYIVEVDVKTGAFATFVPSPLGEADDEAFGPDGTLVWTDILMGLVRSRTPDGTIRIIGNSPPVSPNGVSFDKNGNCYYSQFPAGNNQIFQVSPTNAFAQRVVATLPSPMNGFDFGPDNNIYGALSMTGQVAKVNLVTKVVTIIASGFVDPESVRWSADKTKLYVLDSGIGSVIQINPTTGARIAVVAKIPEFTYIDNFRPYEDSFLLSDTLSNSFTLYNGTTKTIRHITPVSVFSLPMGISYLNGNIYVADFVDQRIVNTLTLKETIVARSGPQPASNGVASQDVSFGIFNVRATPRFSAFSDNYDGRVQVRQTVGNAVYANVPAGWPYGTAFSPEYQYLIVNDYGTGLTVFHGANYSLSYVVPHFPYVNLTGMANAREANSVYVADYTHGAIFLVNYITGAYSTVSTGLSKPEGLDVFHGIDCDQLFVANIGTKTLDQVSVAYGTKAVIAANLPIGLPGPNTLPAPFTFTGVTFDTDRREVYVSSDLSDALIKIGCL